MAKTCLPPSVSIVYDLYEVKDKCLEWHTIVSVIGVVKLWSTMVACLHLYTLSLSDWNVRVHSSGRGRDQSVLRQTVQNFSREDLHQWPVSQHTLHAHTIHSSLPLASLPCWFILIGCWYSRQLVTTQTPISF